MSIQSVPQLINAERRSFRERRRVCLLIFAPGKSAEGDARSGFDRRLAVRLPCSACGKPLFATRDAERRLVLSDRFYSFASTRENQSYQCPSCGAAADKHTLQRRQEELLLGKLHYD